MSQIHRDTERERERMSESEMEICTCAICQNIFLVLFNILCRMLGTVDE